MKIVFMGSPDFAAWPLRKMQANGFTVDAVFSQPDRARGKRGKEMLPTAVKQAALDLGLTVFTPPNINTAESLQQLRQLLPDLLVVVAYGQLLSEELLAIPSLGAINIHGSLLPRYRGAAPMQRALMNGDGSSGVTIIYLDAGMDSGDMIIKQEIELSADETFGSLHDKLMLLGADLLLEALALIEQGCAPRIAQEHQQATYAAKIRREEELVVWDEAATTVHNQIRALDPFPGAYTLSEGKRLKLFGSSLAAGTGAAGTVLAVDEQGITVACKTGAVKIKQVQPEGKKKIHAADYARGYKIIIGGML